MTAKGDVKSIVNRIKKRLIDKELRKERKKNPVKKAKKKNQKSGDRKRRNALAKFAQSTGGLFGHEEVDAAIREAAKIPNQSPFRNVDSGRDDNPLRIIYRSPYGGKVWYDTEFKEYRWAPEGVGPRGEDGDDFNVGFSTDREDAISSLMDTERRLGKGRDPRFDNPRGTGFRLTNPRGTSEEDIARLMARGGHLSDEEISAELDRALDSKRLSHAGSVRGAGAEPWLSTNDIRKGQRVKLKNGFIGVMMDDRRGNIRTIRVEGLDGPEIGDVYAHEIAALITEEGHHIPVRLSQGQRRVISQLRDSGMW